MTNNDILRNLRFVFDFGDSQMISLFEDGTITTNREQVSNWLKREEDKDALFLEDNQLAGFLNGLIILKRGKKDGPTPAPETELSNNMILKKLKIALNFKSEDIISTLELADAKLSNHELTAFFRKPDHKNYRPCKNQILRKFLKGLQLKLRPMPAK